MKAANRGLKYDAFCNLLLLFFSILLVVFFSTKIALMMLRLLNMLCACVRICVCVCVCCGGCGAGAEIDCEDKSRNTPLHIAARYGHELIITALIKHGADTAKSVSLSVCLSVFHPVCLSVSTPSGAELNNDPLGFY